MKTGTKSLAKALTILGLNCFHGVVKYEETARSTGELFPREILDVYDEFCDWPFPDFYQELDQRYPGSKFILTTRDLKSWLKSVKDHMRRNRLNPSYRGNLKFFDTARLTFLWRNHHQKVLGYFANRSRDFLIMDITAGEGWEKLCPFLNQLVPDQSFPHENRSAPAWVDYTRCARRWIKNKWISLCA
jgi:hypothetical protein